jgi:hypothetical protein
MPLKMAVPAIAGIRDHEGRLFILKGGWQRCQRVARRKRFPQNCEPGSPADSPRRARRGGYGMDLTGFAQPFP